MALNQADAVEAARAIMSGARNFEQRRLDLIAAALSSAAPTVNIPESSTSLLKDLASKSQTNYLPLVLDTTSQVMKVEGYRSANAADNAGPWSVWQRNQMDARQTGINRSALAFGAAYVTVLPGRLDGGDDFPLIQGFSPRRMTAVYQNPARDEWPMFALDIDGRIVRLIDDTSIYYFGAKDNGPRSAFIAAGDLFGNGNRLEYIEHREHGLGVCPVVRFRDRMLLEGEEQFGIIEPLIALQRRIDETTFGMLVTQFFAAFRQKYIIGWAPKTAEEKLKASASEFWAFEGLPSDISIGELSVSEPDGYLRSKDSAVQDMSAIAQVPPTSLGVTSVSNISAEALAAFQEGKDRKTDEITTSLGESYEQMFRLAALVQGDTAAANDYGAQVRWKDTTARSLAQLTDALVKQVTAMGMSKEYALSQLPGMTEQNLARNKQLREQEDRIEQARADAVAAGEAAAVEARKTVAVESLPAL